MAAAVAGEAGGDGDQLGADGRAPCPGRANKHLDRAPDPDGTIEVRVPLSGPPGFKPAAIVRITPGTGEVSRPVRGVLSAPTWPTPARPLAVVLDAAGWRRLRELVGVLAGRGGAGR